MAVMDSLRIACLQMTAGAEPAANRDRITDAIPRAAAAGAAILLTPECALCGYPGFERSGFDDFCPCDLLAPEQLIATRAVDAGIAVLLGSASPWRGGISNDALFCGAGTDPRRYRKQCLTPIDRGHFNAGDETVVVPFRGWRLGLSICFDVRFPDIWARQALAEADAFLHIAYMAGPDPDPGCKQSIIPAHYASRAAELATPLVCCNSASDEGWLDSQAWDARGMALASETADDLLIVDLPHRDQHGPWYTGIRDQALARWRRLSNDS